MLGPRPRATVLGERVHQSLPIGNEPFFCVGELNNRDRSSTVVRSPAFLGPWQARRPNVDQPVAKLVRGSNVVPVVVLDGLQQARVAGLLPAVVVDDAGAGVGDRA